MVSESSASGSFSGGIALITGGSQGLGYAVAERLAAEGSAGLLLVGRDRAKGEAAAASLRTQQCRAEFVAADLARSDACEAVIAALDETFGTCHSFVNCAAITDRGSVWGRHPGTVGRDAGCQRTGTGPAQPGSGPDHGPRVR